MASAARIGQHHRYCVNIGVWARNMIDGLLPSSVQDGDSGGSVFTLTTGGVKAKGVISGRGLCIVGCPTYWTDIRVAYYGLPGWLKTG